VPEKLRSADPFIEHPLILAHLERLLQPNYLLSQAQVINILRESPAQPLHVDDGFYPWPRPRPALSVATVFAVDDFSADNGATVVIPGSHRWGQGRLPKDGDERLSAVMPAGSCVLFLGTLWHGGGENRSGASRLAITAQYCEPWLRTQENYFLSVSRDTAAAVSETLRRMLGYSIHPPFMGMTDGMHPKRKLPGKDGG
jgi:ectoine hydroxylase-related dioxygenase (phytanoyl-CoA dioxygenase family)